MAGASTVRRVDGSEAPSTNDGKEAGGPGASHAVSSHGVSSHANSKIATSGRGPAASPTPDGNFSPAVPKGSAGADRVICATDATNPRSEFQPLNLPVAERQTALLELANRVAACTACAELAKSRKQTVFGVGSSQARLCLLGEAPGASEDRLGEPFVGDAGQLLDRILAACTLSRDQVYILNTLKCRPPSNRNPKTDEVARCRSFLEMQLSIIQPEFICCLGLVAAKSLLGTSDSLWRLRGRLHEWSGIKVLVTYHPAYLLRNPSSKAEVWKDMQFLMAEMGIDLSSVKRNRQ